MFAKLWYAGRIVRDDKLGVKMRSPTVVVAFTISTEDQPETHSTVLTYNGMTPQQIAAFETELLEAFLAVHKKWASGK